MNKFRLLYFICSLFLVIFVINQISFAQITNPIPEPIKKSELSVALEEVVQIPDSGTSRKKAARLNLLVHAGDGSGRLFVNDMRGKLYVILRETPAYNDGACSEFVNNTTASVYLNLH